MQNNALGMTRILGGAFWLLGMFSLLFADFFLGTVWVLMGIGLILFTPTRNPLGRTIVEWTPRNIGAAAALGFGVVLAVLLIVLDFTG